MSEDPMFSPGGGRPSMKKLCFVAPSKEEKELMTKIARNYDIAVLQSDDGREFIKDRDVVFFVDDFEGDTFRKLQKLADADHQPLVVGPPFVYERVNSGLELYAPRVKRPLFCTLMQNVLVILGSDISDKKHYVNLIHYMGGRVRKDYQTSLVSRPQSPTKQKTVVYITRKAGRSTQRAACLLQMNTLKPDWVIHCWRQKNKYDYNVFDEKVIREHTLGVFEALSIFFVGFMDSEVADMAKSVRENNGFVENVMRNATHVVCNPNSVQVCEELELSDKQIAVTDQWLWTSVSCSRCLNEDDYSLREYPRLCRLWSPSNMRSKSAGSMDFEASRGSDDYSTDDLEAGMSPMPKTPNTPRTPKSPRVVESKAQQVTIEMLETERSYIHSLELALRFRDLIEDEYIAKEGENPISRADLAVIFGKLPPIVKVHKQILAGVQAHVDGWTTRPTDVPKSGSKDLSGPTEIGEVWVNAKRALIEAYPPYINTYENAKAAFDLADQRSSKFHAFIRAKESNPEFKRNKLMDLLIRPVQRLPSVTLLLKELQKRIEGDKKSNKSIVKRLTEANAAIHDVLTHANQVRFVTDCNIAHLSRFTDMDQVPPHLVCSRRQFIAEMDAVSICGTGDWLDWQKTDVRVILFNDVVVICKIRNQGGGSSMNSTDATPGSTMTRLQRQASLSTLRRKDKKPLKYIKHIPNQFIREVRELRDDSESGPQLYTVYSDSVPIMVVVVRENSFADNVWVIQPKDKGAMDKLFIYVQQQLMMEYNRNIRLVASYPLSELVSIPEIDDPLRKYLKRLQQNGHNATFNFPTMPRNNMFRRAISSASLSVANRLSRMTSSRSNLRDIVETPTTPGGTNTTMNCGPLTPDYNPNPRHSTHSSPDVLDEFSHTFATPKRGLRARISSATFNLNKTLFRRNSIRQHAPMSPVFGEENKENSLEHQQQQ